MSTSAPTPSAHDPNQCSRQPDPPDDLSSTVDLPTDPLLQSGSFIDVNPPTPATGTSGSTTTNAQTLNKKEPVRDKKSAKPDTSNGADSVPAPENTPQRRPAASTGSEALSWLPPGWLIEDRVRASGATAGVVDRYYFDPASGRRFRSKKEVLYFLENGTPRKKKRGMENSDADVDSMGSSGSNKLKSGTRGKAAPLNFDYFNAPEKIQWVLTNTSEDSWTAFIGKDKVPEYIKRDWVSAFTSLTTSNGSSSKF